MNNKAQLHTLEGLLAAVLMTLTVLLITQSTTIVTPQNELAVDVQLEQLSSDALTILDIAPDLTIQYNLTECVASWDQTEASYPSHNLDILNTNLASLMGDTLYNVDFAYVDSGNLKVKKVIINGEPGENAVVVRHFVSLTNASVQSMNGGWNLEDDAIKIVEVRMTSWKV